MLPVTFLLYTILFEALVWIGGMYVIITYDWNPWWVLFLLLLSGAQLKPRHWRFLMTRENKQEKKIIL